MTNWTTDQHGNRIFTHEGWEVRIESPEWNNRIYVETPTDEAEVEVYPEGVWVKGEYAGSVAEAFIIPWEVIAAIIEARKIVGAA